MLKVKYNINVLNLIDQRGMSFFLATTILQYHRILRYFFRNTLEITIANHKTMYL